MKDVLRETGKLQEAERTLPSTLRSAYRGAGLSHVLVVSGLHVTIFCGLLDALPHKERERSRAYRRARSLLRAGTALLLVGITGATPSVLRYFINPNRSFKASLIDGWVNIESRRNV